MTTDTKIKDVKKLVEKEISEIYDKLVEQVDNSRYLTDEYHLDERKTKEKE